MAHYLEMVVVSVEYRLAPEHPFPAALIDCYNSLHWIYDNAATLDVDKEQVISQYLCSSATLDVDKEQVISQYLCISANLSSPVFIVKCDM